MCCLRGCTLKLQKSLEENGVKLQKMYSLAQQYVTREEITGIPFDKTDLYELETR